MATGHGTIGEILVVARDFDEYLSLEWHLPISDFQHSEKVGDWYTSPEFKFCAEWWCLDLCLNYLGRKSGPESLKLGLKRKNPEGPPVKITFTFGVRGRAGLEKNVKGFEYDSCRDSTGLCVIGLWERSDLMDDESRQMPGDLLIITCDLRPTAAEEADDWEYDLERLSSDFGRLLQGGIHPDVKLKCGERIVPAHKCVLTARSPVFAGRIREDMRGSGTGLVDISDLGVDVDIFLQYVYEGRLPKASSAVIPQLYIAAVRFEMEALKLSCRDRMVRTLSDSNCIELLKWADSQSEASIKEAAVTYVSDRKEVLTSEAWKKFAEQSRKLAMEVYDRYVQNDLHSHSTRYSLLQNYEDPPGILNAYKDIKIVL